MNITVLGCGRWGSFIAWYLDRCGFRITLWGREGSDRLADLMETRQNALLTLGPDVELTDDLGYAVSKSDIVVISISAQGLRSLCGQLSTLGVYDKTLVLCMKGLEVETGRRLTEVVAEELGSEMRSAIWVGPGHVQDFTAGVPNCMVIDSGDPDVRTELVDILSAKGDLIRFYYGTDLIGNEIGAASKNVIGIAAGMLDGFSYTSLKGALMSRGTREISRLIKAAGGNEISAYGLSHLGDYEATVFSPYSNNRMFGELYVKGEKYEKLAEGVATTKALMALSARYGVELPICATVGRILFEKEDPESALQSLFLRTIKHEFY